MKINVLNVINWWTIKRNYKKFCEAFPPGWIFSQFIPYNMAASGDKVGSSKDQSEENQKHICFLPGEPSMNHLQGVAQK